MCLSKWLILLWTSTEEVRNNAFFQIQVTNNERPQKNRSWTVNHTVHTAASSSVSFWLCLKKILQISYVLYFHFFR